MLHISGFGQTAPTDPITRAILPQEFEAFKQRLRRDWAQSAWTYSGGTFPSSGSSGPGPVWYISTGRQPYQTFEFDDGSRWGAFLDVRPLGGALRNGIYATQWLSESKLRQLFEELLSLEAAGALSVTYKPWPKDWTDWVDEHLCQIIGAAAAIATADPSQYMKVTSTCNLIRLVGMSPQEAFVPDLRPFPGLTYDRLRLQVKKVNVSAIQASYPTGTIAAWDPGMRKFRIAVPASQVAAAQAQGLAGLGQGDGYVEIAPQAIFPEGASAVPLDEFQRRTGTGKKWYRSGTFWLWTGLAVAATAAVVKSK